MSGSLADDEAALAPTAGLDQDAGDLAIRGTDT
jgi:hypothetical protein